MNLNHRLIFISSNNWQGYYLRGNIIVTTDYYRFAIAVADLNWEYNEMENRYLNCHFIVQIPNLKIKIYQ